MSHNKTFARFIISKTKRGVDDERKWFSSVKLTTGLLLNFQLRPTTRQSWPYSLWKSVETIFRTAMMEGEEIYSNFHSYTLRCTIHPFSPASLLDVLFLLSSLLVHSLLPRVSCFFNLLFLSPLFLFFLFLFFFFFVRSPLTIHGKKVYGVEHKGSVHIRRARKRPNLLRESCREESAAGDKDDHKGDKDCLFGLVDNWAAVGQCRLFLHLFLRLRSFWSTHGSLRFLHVVSVFSARNDSLFFEAGINHFVFSPQFLVESCFRFC